MRDWKKSPNKVPKKNVETAVIHVAKNGNVTGSGSQQSNKEVTMLIISRRPGESFYIELAESVDPNLTVAELFGDGPIQIAILGVKGNKIRVGTEASDRLTILRDELV